MHDLGVAAATAYQLRRQPVDLSSYGTSPAVGALDGATGTPVTLVGYGAQAWVSHPGGRTTIFTFVRTQAPATLIDDTNANSNEFFRVSTDPGQDQGGVGPGDSGSPAFLHETTTVAAVGSRRGGSSGQSQTLNSEYTTSAAARMSGRSAQPPGLTRPVS